MNTLDSLLFNHPDIYFAIKAISLVAVIALSAWAVGILNRAWNHLWLDSEDSRGLGLELIVLAEAMRAVRTEVQ